jgi:hypothetical protein
LTLIGDIAMSAQTASGSPIFVPLDFLVDTTGHVEPGSIVYQPNTIDPRDTALSPVVVDAAKTIAARCRFEPARNHGQVVAVSVTQTIVVDRYRFR